LNPDREFSPLGIDPEAFAAALHAGAVDACLVYARQSERGCDENAELNRRVAETLFHRGHREEALECGRRALGLAGSDPEILNVCAWLFSNCGCHEEAAEAFQGLLELYPDWTEGYRHASGSLMAIGAITEAIDCALEACARGPQNSEYALHAGSLLLSIGGRNEAAAWAEEAAALAPDDVATVISAAELLMRSECADRAAEILRTAAAAHGAGDPVLFRVLSAAEMLLGRFEDALTAIDAALALAPEQAEYYLHRGHILTRLGELAAADAAFEDAAALDPANPDLKRAQIELFLIQGRVTEATAVGGELLTARPHDSVAVQAVMHVLGERLQTVEGDFVVLHDSIERAPRPLRPLPGFLDRLRSQRRVIRALIIRETRTRFGDSKLGYGWALLEPIMHITLLSLAFSVLMRGEPPIGSHFFLFYYTGLVRYSGANGTRISGDSAGRHDATHKSTRPTLREAPEMVCCPRSREPSHQAYRQARRR
jgi:tetratricopeptide (TPR) repeat protein